MGIYNSGYNNSACLIKLTCLPGLSNQPFDEAYGVFAQPWRKKVQSRRWYGTNNGGGQENKDATKTRKVEGKLKV